jgi:hypothetical protein
MDLSWAQPLPSQGERLARHFEIVPSSCVTEQGKTTGTNFPKLDQAQGQEKQERKIRHCHSF